MKPSHAKYAVLFVALIVAGLGETSTARAGQWTRTQIAKGSVGEQALAVSAGGEVIVVWTTTGHLGREESVRVASAPPGQRPGRRQTLATKADFGKLPFDAEPKVTVAANGEAIATWTETSPGGHTPKVVAAIRQRGRTTFDRAQPLSSPPGHKPALAMNDAGAAIISYEALGYGPLFVAVRLPGQDFGAPVMVSGGNAGDPQVAIDRDNVATIVWGPAAKAEGDPSPIWITSGPITQPLPAQRLLHDTTTDGSELAPYLLNVTANGDALLSWGIGSCCVSVRHGNSNFGSPLSLPSGFTKSSDYPRRQALDESGNWIVYGPRKPAWRGHARIDSGSVAGSPIRSQLVHGPKRVRLFAAGAAFAPSGNALVAFSSLRTDGNVLRAVTGVYVASRRDAKGTFTRPVRLFEQADRTLDDPAEIPVAFDAQGRATIAWISGPEHRALWLAHNRR